MSNTIGISPTGVPVIWNHPVGIDPALPYESLLFGASVYAHTLDTKKAEASALQHFYNAGSVDIKSFIN